MKKGVIECTSVNVRTADAIWILARSVTAGKNPKDMSAGCRNRWM